MLQGRELGPNILVKLYTSITTLVCVGSKLIAHIEQRECISWKCWPSLGLGRAAGVKTQPEHEQRQLAQQIRQQEPEVR